MNSLRSKYKIAGLVVVTNPKDEGEVIENINSYLNQIDILYVVDNSEKPVSRIVGSVDNPGKILHIFNNGNFGIGRALNLGASKALENGFDFLLTMDEDSKATPHMIEKMLECTKGKDQSKIGIIASHWKKKPSNRFNTCGEVLFTITSGSLLKLSAFEKVGPFMEELFIDCIDFDYCLRLYLNGFKVIHNRSAILKHRPGNRTTHKIFFWNFTTANYSYLRRYYKARNRLYLFNKYRNSFGNIYRFKQVFGKKRILSESLKILLFEKDKLRKVKMTILGYLDYKRKRLGKLIE
ncbi:MAG: glycosyltransferase family 2 protein [Candidatus Hodarchaeota archaeon]